MNQQEKWLPVVGFEGLYEVSDMGRVRSLDRLRANGKLLMRGRVLKPHPNSKSGYLNVVLSRGTKLTRLVHSLVLRAFVGPCPEGMECCHDDGNSGNCKLSNLRWDTHKNNNADKSRHGTMLTGARNHQSKFSETDIERVFDLRRSGCTQQQIADWLEMSQPTVSEILRGERWAHLGLAPKPRTILDPFL